MVVIPEQNNCVLMATSEAPCLLNFLELQYSGDLFLNSQKKILGKGFVTIIYFKKQEPKIKTHLIHCFGTIGA